MPLGSLVVLIYVVALYVRPQDWVPGLVGLPTAIILTPLGLVASLPDYLRDRERFRTPQNKLLAAYLAVIFLSTLVAVDPSTAIGQLWLFTKRAMLFVMVVWALTSAEQIYRVVWAILLMSLFLAFQAVLQATTGECWGGLTPYPGYDEIRVRWYGDWDGPNVFGILFVLSTAIALELALGPYSTRVRFGALGLIASYATAIYLTNSRGAVVALAVATVFYLRRRLTTGKAVLAVALALGALLYMVPSRMSQLNTDEASARERSWAWEQGLDLLRQHPFLGVGRGQFAQSIDSRLLAHNNYVQNFTETGLVGFFCFTGLLWLSYRGTSLVADPPISDPPRELDPRLGSLGRMMTATLVGYATATFFVVMELELLYFFLGLYAAVYLVARREADDFPLLEFTWKDTAVILAAMAVVIIVVWLIAVKEII